MVKNNRGCGLKIASRAISHIIGVKIL